MGIAPERRDRLGFPLSKFFKPALFGGYQTPLCHAATYPIPPDPTVVTYSLQPRVPPRPCKETPSQVMERVFPALAEVEAIPGDSVTVLYLR